MSEVLGTNYWFTECGNTLNIADPFPAQAGHKGEALFTNGQTVYWGDVTGGLSFENALTDSSGTVRFGGTLVKDTEVPGAGYDLSLGLSTDRIKNFAIDANHITLDTDGGVSHGVLLSYNSAKQIELSGDKTAIVVSDTDSSMGLIYGADYSLNYIDRSLPDKFYVDSHIGGQAVSALVKSPGVGQDGYAIVWDNVNNDYNLVAAGSGTYTFTNGLTESSGTVKLGGNIASDTTLSINNVLFEIKTLSGAGTNSRQLQFVAGEGIHIGFYANNDYTGDRSYIDVGSPTDAFVALTYERSGGSNKYIQIGEGMIVADNDSLTGLVYNADYSSNYNNRSLVDKGYVESRIGNHTHVWADITSTPTTLSGYGITDVYTKTNLGTSGGAVIHWDNLTATPTTLAGYGITDAAPLSHVGSGGSAHAEVTAVADGFMLASDKKKLDNISPRDLAKTFLTLTGTSVVWDMNSGYNRWITLTANTVIGFSGLESGDYGTLIVDNPSVAYTITFPAGSKQGGGGGATITMSGGNKRDIITFVYDGALHLNVVYDYE